MAKDVEYLAQFVDSLNVPILRENLDELQQTVQLMQADNADEFYDISTRNKKYGRVDAMQGPLLLEKYGALRLGFLDFANLISGLLAQSKHQLRSINLRHCPRDSRRRKIPWRGELLCRWEGFTSVDYRRSSEPRCRKTYVNLTMSRNNYEDGRPLSRISKKRRKNPQWYQLCLGLR